MRHPITQNMHDYAILLFELLTYQLSIKSIMSIIEEEVV